MAIYFPVDSGAVVEVAMNCYPDTQRIRPVNAYIISGGNPALNRSVELAAEIAYERARQHSGECGGRCYILAVQLKRESDDVSLNGESGGLAFALASFSKLCKVEYGCSVAATGQLEGVSENGKVKKIGALPEKLHGLLDTLESNSKIFYPEANDYVLSTLLAEGFKKKNISLHPVLTVQEALDVLLGAKVVSLPEKTIFNKRLVSVAVLALVLAGFAGSFFFFSLQEKSTQEGLEPDQAVAAPPNSIEVASEDPLEIKTMPAPQSNTEQKPEKRSFIFD